MFLSYHTSTGMEVVDSPLYQCPSTANSNQPYKNLLGMLITKVSRRELATMWFDGNTRLNATARAQCIRWDRKSFL